MFPVDYAYTYDYDRCQALGCVRLSIPTNEKVNLDGSVDKQVEFPPECGVVVVDCCSCSYTGNASLTKVNRIKLRSFCGSSSSLSMVGFELR